MKIKISIVHTILINYQVQSKEYVLMILLSEETELKLNFVQNRIQLHVINTHIANIILMNLRKQLKIYAPILMIIEVICRP